MKIFVSIKGIIFNFSIDFFSVLFFCSLFIFIPSRTRWDIADIKEKWYLHGPYFRHFFENSPSKRSQISPTFVVEECLKKCGSMHIRCFKITWERQKESRNQKLRSTQYFILPDFFPCMPLLFFSETYSEFPLKNKWRIPQKISKDFLKQFPDSFIH